MLENKKYEGVHYSRFIASWHNVGGRKAGIYAFEDWLEHLGLDANTIHDILEMEMGGKMELEKDARQFINNYKEE